jgi:hypothetical protein
MTTQALSSLPGTVSAPLTLPAEVWRDTDVPDLGWHCPALDYLASNVVVIALVTLKAVDAFTGPEEAKS